MSWKSFVLEQAMEYGKKIMEEHFGRTLASIQHREGGLFISCMDNGKMMAAYWHPTKQHSGACIHYKVRVVQRAESEPGYWAIAIAKSPLFGAETKYNAW